MDFDLIEALIQTRALRIAPPGELFWYTSGTVGPYYINTHFLLGGEQVAQEMLAWIEEQKEDREAFPAQLRQRVESAYQAQPVYRGVVDLLVARLAGRVEAETGSPISGGERRDWFFSTAVALVMDRPHLLLYKDGGMVREDGGTVERIRSLEGRRCLHVADLVTEASSYLRAWIPTIRQAGGRMAWSLNVVDRGQGGLETLAAAGVEGEALIRVDDRFFQRLHGRGLVDEGQLDLLCAYFADPQGSMKRFLERHPDFLQAALHDSDPKTAARARLLIERNPYQLDLRRWT